MSREVTIPSNLEYILPVSVMGIPQNPYLALMASTSATVLDGLRQNGSTINPFSYFLTRRTMRACSSTGQLWWITPIPPMSCSTNRERKDGLSVGAGPVQKDQQKLTAILIAISVSVILIEFQLKENKLSERRVRSKSSFRFKATHR